jgi:hypothetical protein
MGVYKNNSLNLEKVWLMRHTVDHTNTHTYVSFKSNALRSLKYACSHTIFIYCLLKIKLSASWKVSVVVLYCSPPPLSLSHRPRETSSTISISHKSHTHWIQFRSMVVGGDRRLTLLSGVLVLRRI